MACAAESVRFGDLGFGDDVVEGGVETRSVAAGFDDDCIWVDIMRIKSDSFMFCGKL